MSMCKEQVVNGLLTDLRLGSIEPIPERIQASLSYYEFITKQEVIHITEYVLKKYNEEKNRI